MEELKYGDSKNGHKWIKDGVNFTRGPGTYKIPTSNDVPEEFNVTLLHDSKNPRAVQSSKAVGEPPFLLGNSVYFAVKDAIYYARQEDECENEKEKVIKGNENGKKTCVPVLRCETKYLTWQKQTNVQSNIFKISIIIASKICDIWPNCYK